MRVEIRPEVVVEAAIQPQGPLSKRPNLCQGAYLVPTIEPAERLRLTPEQQEKTHWITGDFVRAFNDDCRHHLAAMMVDHRGHARPVTCSGQGEGPFPGENYSVGEVFVSDRTKTMGTNGFALLAGHAYGIVPYENPQTYVVAWNSTWGSGPPA